MNKKKLIILVLSVVILLSFFAIPVSAETPELLESFLDGVEEIIEGPIKSLKESIDDWFEGFKDEIKDISDTMKNFKDIGKLFSKTIDEFENREARVDLMALRNGGAGYAKGLNETIKSIYNFLYPFGVGIMLICWIFGCVKSGITSSIDFSDKHSIVRALISLIIGLFAMAIAPKLLSVLTSVSFSACQGLWENIETSPLKSSDDSNSWGYLIFIFIVQFIYRLNILYMALLQGISPIFVGFFGGESTRKIALNFVKEYAKCLLIPIITLAYAALMLKMMTTSFELVTGLVLGISAIGIAGKKLDKLIS